MSTNRQVMTLVVTFGLFVFCTLLGEAIEATDIRESSRWVFYITVPGFMTAVILLIWEVRL